MHTGMAAAEDPPWAGPPPLWSALSPRIMFSPYTTRAPASLCDWNHQTWPGASAAQPLAVQGAIRRVARTEEGPTGNSGTEPAAASDALVASQHLTILEEPNMLFLRHVILRSSRHARPGHLESNGWCSGGGGRKKERVRGEGKKWDADDG